MKERNTRAPRVFRWGTSCADGLGRLDWASSSSSPRRSLRRHSSRGRETRLTSLPPLNSQPGPSRRQSGWIHEARTGSWMCWASRSTRSPRSGAPGRAGPGGGAEPDRRLAVPAIHDGRAADRDRPRPSRRPHQAGTGGQSCRAATVDPGGTAPTSSGGCGVDQSGASEGGGGWSGDACRAGAVGRRGGTGDPSHRAGGDCGRATR